MAKLVYDTVLSKPACALLQAALGGDPGIANRFNSEHWLIAPTPAMHCYEVTEELLQRIVATTNERHKVKHARK